MTAEPRRGQLYDLPDKAKSRLLDWARSIIVAALRSSELPAPTGIGHQIVAGCFVTLRRIESGALRGCRGLLFRPEPLPTAVAFAAQAAALDDIRFPPVTEPEMKALAIEISLLSEPSPIDPESIEVGRHGLIVRSAGRLGLLLPGVATDYGWSVLTYLNAVCAKAGLPAGAWRQPNAELLGFETISWHEPSWPERSMDSIGSGGDPQEPYAR
jgi:AmmeMemoRadiSam system protein A